MNRFFFLNQRIYICIKVKLLLAREQRPQAGKHKEHLRELCAAITFRQYSCSLVSSRPPPLQLGLLSLPRTPFHTLDVSAVSLSSSPTLEEFLVASPQSIPQHRAPGWEALVLCVRIDPGTRRSGETQLPSMTVLLSM